MKEILNKLQRFSNKQTALAMTESVEKVAAQMVTEKVARIDRAEEILKDMK